MMADPRRACAATTLPAMLPRLTLASLALASLSLAGCGGSGRAAADGPEQAPGTEPTTAPTASTAAPSAEAAAQSAPAGELPDPCTLLDAEQLADLLGTDLGEGTVAGPAPSRRRTCTFESGVVLAVEVASGWDAALARLRRSGADGLEPAPGIGRAAYWQERGRQVLALGEDHLVGVSGADQAAGKAVAEGMLAAL